MNLYSRSLAFVRGTLLMILALCCATLSAQAAAPSPARERVKPVLSRLPLHCEAAADGGLSSRVTGRRVHIHDGDAVTCGEAGRNAVSVLLDGASPQATSLGQDLFKGRSNYLIGNDRAKWRTVVSQFGRVKIPAVYPGVDLVYYGNGNQLERD